MPEHAEIRSFVDYVNLVSSGAVYESVRSLSPLCAARPDLSWVLRAAPSLGGLGRGGRACERFSLRACQRGKQMKLLLSPVAGDTVKRRDGAECDRSDEALVGTEGRDGRKSDGSGDRPSALLLELNKLLAGRAKGSESRSIAGSAAGVRSDVVESDKRQSGVSPPVMPYPFIKRARSVQSGEGGAATSEPAQQKGDLTLDDLQPNSPTLGSSSGGEQLSRTQSPPSTASPERTAGDGKQLSASAVVLGIRRPGPVSTLESTSAAPASSPRQPASRAEEGGSSTLQASIVMGAGLAGFFSVEDSLAKAIQHHAILAFCAENGGPVLCLCTTSPETVYWRVGDFDLARGPDPVSDYDRFCRNVVASLRRSPAALRRPVCELLHDQRLFNGVGNYLRAEIIARLRIPPFSPASILFPGLLQPDLPVSALEKRFPVLKLCRTLCEEAYSLSGDPEKFSQWLLCYGKAPNAVRDANNRLIWFFGEPGDQKPRRNEASSSRYDTASATESRASSSRSRTQAHLFQEALGLKRRPERARDGAERR